MVSRKVLLKAASRLDVNPAALLIGGRVIGVGGWRKTGWLTRKSLWFSPTPNPHPPTPPKVNYGNTDIHAIAQRQTVVQAIVGRTSCVRTRQLVQLHRRARPCAICFRIGAGSDGNHVGRQACPFRALCANRWSVR